MPELIQEIKDMNKYIDNLTIKTLGIENDSNDVLAKLHLADDNLRAISKDAHLDLADIRSELRECEQQLSQATIRIDKLIREFKTTVKREELMKFEIRLDEWPLEQFATRKDLRSE